MTALLPSLHSLLSLLICHVAHLPPFFLNGTSRTRDTAVRPPVVMIMTTTEVLDHRCAMFLRLTNVSTPAALRAMASVVLGCANMSVSIWCVDNYREVAELK